MAEGHLIAPPLLSADGWPYASSRPVDAEDPGRFHALFGRDPLITSLAVIGVQPGVARATLRVLAKLQGSTLDPETDEEPGKIVHEFRPNPEPRFVEMGWPVRDGVLRYYGSADGTAWFLIVLAVLDDAALTEELDGAWRAASAWLEQALRRAAGSSGTGPASRRAVSSNRAGATRRIRTPRQPRRGGECAGGRRRAAHDDGHDVIARRRVARAGRGNRATPSPGRHVVRRSRSRC